MLLTRNALGPSNLSKGKSFMLPMKSPIATTSFPTDHPQHVSSKESSFLLSTTAPGNSSNLAQARVARSHNII